MTTNRPAGACAEKRGQSIGPFSTLESCIYPHDHTGAHRAPGGATWTTIPTTAAPYCDAEPPDAGHGCDRPPNHSGPHITSDYLNGYQLWGLRCGEPHPYDAAPCDREAGHTGRHSDATASKWLNTADMCPANHPPTGQACMRDPGHDGCHEGAIHTWENNL